MPVKEIMREQKDVPSNLKDLVANMVYVGILAQSIGIDLEKIKAALEFHFKGKQKPIDLNYNVVQDCRQLGKRKSGKERPLFC